MSTALWIWDVLRTRNMDCASYPASSVVLRTQLCGTDIIVLHGLWLVATIGMWAVLHQHKAQKKKRAK